MTRAFTGGSYGCYGDGDGRPFRHAESRSVAAEAPAAQAKSSEKGQLAMIKKAYEPNEHVKDETIAQRGAGIHDGLLMSYLVAILLPLSGDNGRVDLKQVRDELTELFGGVTMHINAPAEGVWENEGGVDRDNIIVIEVMTDDLDRRWWAAYREELEHRLDQEEIVIRATSIERL
jgi:hypothetical protein